MRRVHVYFALAILFFLLATLALMNDGNEWEDGYYAPQNGWHEVKP